MSSGATHQGGGGCEGVRPHSNEGGVGSRPISGEQDCELVQPQCRLRLTGGGTSLEPFARALEKLGPESPQEETVFAANGLRWGCSGEGEQVESCEALMGRAISAGATTVILATLPELVREDSGFDAVTCEWRGGGLEAHERRGKGEQLSRTLEKASEAGLALVATWFITDAGCGGATQQEAAFLVWERKSAWLERLPGLRSGSRRVNRRV